MAKVYCFGNTENGELGLGGIEEEHILSPRKQRLPYDRRKYSLISVASGRNHTLMLLRNISHDCNIVFSCGSNERQQLGRVGSWKKLEIVDSLSHHNILNITCGTNHCLVLSEAGQLFSWGCNLFGQLGVASRECQEIGKPTLVKKLAAKVIVQVASGSNHCLALTKNGELYVWGSNAFGQLGIGTFGNCVSTPTLLLSLQWTPILKIAGGGSHSAVLSYLGSIYLWGKNEFGQLGLNDTKNRNLPTVQRSLRDQKIAYISLGEEHSAALTDEGGLFTFGAGMYGQLGHGRNSNEILPRKVFELMGRNIIQVSCGRCHTLVATNYGRVYSFGLNGSGQLGIGTTKSKYVPTDVRGPWIEVNVKEVLIRDFESSLCTVDFDSQNLPIDSQNLSTDSQSNENVAYITSNTESSVTDNVATSETSTMEIDEITDESIPSGSSEITGNSVIVEEPDDVDLSDKSPGFVCMDSTVFTKNQSIVIDEYESDPDSDIEEDPQRKQFVLKEIVVSKGDQNFVLLQPYGENTVPRAFKQIDSSNEILKLDNSIIEQFKDVSKEALPLEIVDYIEEVFSSIPSWNASYILDSGHNDKIQKLCKFFKSSGIDTGDCLAMDNGKIDWGQAFHAFNMIDDAQNERITELVCQSICKILNQMPDISFKGRKDCDLYPECLDEEVLRIYQMIPLFHLFRMTDTYSENSQQLITLYANAILRISKEAACSLTVWWCRMEKRYFKSVIQIFKKSIEFNLLQQIKMNNDKPEEKNKQPSKIDHNLHENLAICLEVLKLFYDINKVTETVSYKEFYIIGISDMFDLELDYVLWKNNLAGSTGKKEYFLCNFPFIFDAPAKNLILSIDSRIQQQYAIDNSIYRQYFLSLQTPIQFPPNPFLVISVHRNTILNETINQLCLFSKHNVTDFKKPLRIYFEGEEAIDAGAGMKKEFFLLLMKEILDEKYGMFMEYKETNTIWFHHSNDDDLVMYQLIGILCGLAIYNNVIINLPYPLVLYKKILKESLELDDLSFLDPLLTKNLKEIVATSFEKEEFDAIFSDLNFTITLQTFGSPVEFELCPDGQSKRLTYDNREEYVSLYWKYILENSIQKQFDSFQEGFMKVLDTDILKIFHAEELMQLVSGQHVQDWEELESATDYKPPFHKDHPTIKLFWMVFHSFTDEEKKKFLLFLTGSDRIPILGVKALKVMIQPMKVSEDHLPVVHTCFNILDLPQDYTSEDREEKLRSKLLKACEFTHGFALV